MFGSNSQVIVNYSRLPGFDTENERYKSIEAEKTQQKERQSCKSTAFYVLVVLIFTGLFVVVTLESHKRPLPPSQTCQSIEVRPEWRTLSDQEKSAYLKAVQCLRTVPSRLGLTQSLFDDFPYFHTRTGQAGMF